MPWYIHFANSSQIIKEKKYSYSKTFSRFMQATCLREGKRLHTQGQASCLEGARLIKIKFLAPNHPQISQCHLFPSTHPFESL